MDLVVDNNGGVNVNVVVGAKRAKPCVKTSLSPAFDSPFKAKRSLSNESVYEIIGESINGDSDNETFNSDDDTDLHKNMNGQLNGLETSKNMNQNNSQDPSDSAEMDEMFVIIDDDGNDTSDEKNDCCEKTSDAKSNASGCDNMDAILKEFSESGKENVSRLSDNEDELEPTESAVGESGVTETKNVKKTKPRVILSSDDDAIDSLLEDFREESSSDENSVPFGKNANAASATPTEKLKPCANNDFTIFKSLSTDDVNNKIISSHGDLQETSRQNSATENSITESNTFITDKNVSEIVMVQADEKSNDSDIEIIDDDNEKSKKKNSQNKCDGISKTTFSKLSSPLNSPSFSSSSEDKFEFDSMILDIVDESSPAKEDKSDNVHSNSKSNEYLSSDSVENKSNDNNINKNGSFDFSKLTSKTSDCEERLSSQNNASSVNDLGENGQLSSNKLKSDNEMQSDVNNKFLSFNGSVSSNSDLSSNMRKDSEAQDMSNSSITMKITAAEKQGFIFFFSFENYLIARFLI